MRSKWENVAHNGLIFFFQHNYIPTFEQWLWDRVCVISTWFGDICCSRRDLYVLQKVTITISNSIRCGFIPQDQCNVACLESCIKQKCTGDRPSPLCEAATNYAFWSTRCESAGFRRYSYNVSWYFVFKEVVRYAAHRVWYSFALEVHGFPHW